MKGMAGVLVFILVFIGIIGGCEISQIPSDRNKTSIEEDKKTEEQSEIEENGEVGKIEKIEHDLDKIDSKLIEGNTVFAFDLFRELNMEDPNENIFISPFSISAALSMTYNGADSTTKEAMGKALHYIGVSDEDFNKGYKNLLQHLNNIDPEVELNISNSIWFKKGEEIRKEFLAVNKDNFGAHIAEMDFQDNKTVSIINEWVSNATKGKIDKVLNPPIDRQTLMYLINAIYFKGQWTRQFDEKHTFDGIFNTEDKEKKEVQMMQIKDKIEYGELEGSKIVRFPYGNEKVAMYLILPEENTKISDYIKDLNAGKWVKLKDSLVKRGEVTLQIPKFKIEYGIKNLNDSLIALGMGEVFSDSADFSRIRKDTCISNVLHKAIIEVDEEGSEAAAVTVVEIRTTAAFKPITFIADRPFLFVISDDETGSILFIGNYIK